MTFEEYLRDKKIDGPKFKINEPERWEEWASLFEKMSPASFTSQKLYLINPVRRNYRLQADLSKAKPEPPSTAGKPVFKPKIP